MFLGDPNRGLSTPLEVDVDTAWVKCKTIVLELLDKHVPRRIMHIARL